jgi:hypothetical protein
VDIDTLAQENTFYDQQKHFLLQIEPDQRLAR